MNRNSVPASTTSLESKMVLLRSGDAFPLENLNNIHTNSAAKYSDKPKLIFVFSTQCGYCKNTLPIWKSLYASADTGKIATAAISLSSVEETISYAKEYSIPYALAVPANQKEFVHSHHIFSTPLTLLLNANNIIVHIWYGELSERHRSEILNEIHSLVKAE